MYDMLHSIRYESEVARDLLTYAFAIECDLGDYFDYEPGKGMVSYIPKNRIAEAKQQYSRHDLFTCSGRQKIRPGRAMKAIFSGNVQEYTQHPSDHAIEIFTNMFKAQDPQLMGEISLVEGEAIRYWYNERNYAPGQYSLNESCMRYASRSHLFDVYVENPDIVKLLIVVHKETKKLLGRAIVWTLPEGTFVDRIYGSQITEQVIKNYATEQGWYTAIHHAGVYWQHGNTRVRKPLMVKLDNWKFPYYPYMDTMRFLDWRNGVLSNIADNGYDVYLDGTDGDDHEGFSDLFAWCTSCAEYYEIESTCSNCVPCETCGMNLLIGTEECSNCVTIARRAARYNSYPRSQSFNSFDNYNTFDASLYSRYRPYPSAYTTTFTWTPNNAWHVTSHENE